MPVLARGQPHFSEEEIANLTPETLEFWRYRARVMQVHTAPNNQKPDEH